MPEGDKFLQRRFEVEDNQFVDRGNFEVVLDRGSERFGFKFGLKFLGKITAMILASTAAMTPVLSGAKWLNISLEEPVNFLGVAYLTGCAATAGFFGTLASLDKLSRPRNYEILSLS